MLTQEKGHFDEPKIFSLFRAFHVAVYRRMKAMSQDQRTQRIQGIIQQLDGVTELTAYAEKIFDCRFPDSLYIPPRFMPTELTGTTPEVLTQICDLQAHFFQTANFYRFAQQLNVALRAQGKDTQALSADQVSDWWTLLQAILWLVNANSRKE